MRNFVLCLDLGSGWKAAVLDTEREYTFIREELIEPRRVYLVGGSTDTMITNDCCIDYSAYKTTRPGIYKSYIIKLILLLVKINYVYNCCVSQGGIQIIGPRDNWIVTLKSMLEFLEGLQ